MRIPFACALTLTALIVFIVFASNGQPLQGFIWSIFPGVGGFSLIPHGEQRHQPPPTRVASRSATHRETKT